MIEILNRHYLDPDWRDAPLTWYIGRGGPLGNPYLVKDHGRDEAIRLYQTDIEMVIRSKGAESVRLNGPAAYAELLRLAGLYRLGVSYKLVCSCKPQACHGDVLAIVIPSLARSLGLCVGDWVRHVDERCHSHKWTGSVVWMDESFSICDVSWIQVMQGIELKHPVKGSSYSYSPFPMRYPLDRLERIS